MHAVLALEETVGEIALDVYSAAFDACLVALQKVGNGCAVAMSLGPAQIHAHEHLCPVLALGAAGSGVYFEDGAHDVAFAA